MSDLAPPASKRACSTLLLLQRLRSVGVCRQVSLADVLHGAAEQQREALVSELSLPGFGKAAQHESGATSIECSNPAQRLTCKGAHRNNAKAGIFTIQPAVSFLSGGNFCILMFFTLDQSGKSRYACLMAQQVQNYVCYRKIALFSKQNILEYSSLKYMDSSGV